MQPDATVMVGAEMTTARRLNYSYAEYLTALADSDIKLEYCDGVIFALAGGTPQHAELAGAAIALLRTPLEGKCKVYTSDLKVRIDATDLSTFPDVSVVCGPLQTSKIDANSVTNPVVLVEVTSDSTESYDRGEKLSHYKQLSSLKAVLFISHRRQQVTVVSRAGAGWDEREFRPGETVTLLEPELHFTVDGLYRGIEL